ncbi:unnamed protein product [Spirodela intermedia]|uniref:Uncharacterized protein n=1 Tax=Spirodela intermedia TaxID=51605 RepID=A0A7I8IY82_SPIIN|nr:unnamed protein product [Spirodela intermedia]CAA6662759.1 unnamed protein product [Spirodela intermedia]
MMNCNSLITPLEVRRIFNQKEGRDLVNATTYKSLMGSLRYLTHTRPDLPFSVGFMENSLAEHLKCLKRVLRYIKGTLNFGLKYKKEKFVFADFYDSDYGVDTEERKSTSGFCFFIGNSPVTWVSQKQIIVALLSCEAEYISLTLVACQGVWLVKFLKELTKIYFKSVKIQFDNISAIELAKNPAFHSQLKHIKIRYHYVRNCVEDGEVEVAYVSMEKTKCRHSYKVSCKS